MGIIITKDKKGYMFQSSISDENWFDAPVTEDEAKKALIDEAMWKFIENIITIDMEFPSCYTVNGVFPVNNRGLFNSMMIELYKEKEKNMGEILFSKYKEIMERLNIEFYIQKRKDD